MTERPPLLRCLVCGCVPSTTLEKLIEQLTEAPDAKQKDVAYIQADGNPAAVLLAGQGCDRAIVVIEAASGITVPALDICLALHLLGVRHVAFAVAGADGAPVDQSTLDSLGAAFQSVAQRMSFSEIDVFDSQRPPALWHAPSATTPTRDTAPTRPIRVVVGTCGEAQAINGALRTGDTVAILPAGRVNRIKSITRDGQPLALLDAGVAAQITLDDGIDLQPGDVLSPPAQRPEIADQVAAHIVWAAKEPLFPGRPYGLRCGAQTATATVSTLKYKINAATLEHVAARTLENGKAAFCNLSISHPIVFDPYETAGATGLFELTDASTGKTVGIGLIKFGLRRAENVHWQALSIDKQARASAKAQSPCCLWFTGLSGSGKSTIANLLERKLHSTGRHTYILDGDNVRHGLNRDLGFADADRVENIRRVAEVAKLMVDAGLIVIVSFISPFKAERRMARDLFKGGEFLEVFVETPIEVCEARDPKGLYAKARQGMIRNFTGIDSVYEQPDTPELRLDTTTADPADLAARLLAELGVRGLV